MILDRSFLDYLEQVVTNACTKSDQAELAGFWCDGVLLSESDEHYSQKHINDHRVVKLKAFVGKNGQTEYELILFFGNKALSKYARNLSIQECLPLPEQKDRFVFDLKKRRIDIQLD